MLKINASVSKKVPLPGIEYASQGFSAAVEIELGDGATPDEIQRRIHEVYALLRETIDQEIAGTTGQHTTPQFREQPRITQYEQRGNGGNGNGNGGGGGSSNGGGGNGRQTRLASQAQVKAVFAIGKSLSLERSEIIGMVQHQFGCDCVEALQMRQASDLIEQLKARQTR